MLSLANGRLGERAELAKKNCALQTTDLKDALIPGAELFRMVQDQNGAI